MTKGFPNIPTDSSPGLFSFLGRVREVLEILLGVRGDKLDKAVTNRDLIRHGLISEDDI